MVELELSQVAALVLAQLSSYAVSTVVGLGTQKLHGVIRGRGG